MQSRYNATSSEMEGLKKDIQEVSKLRGTLEKQLTKIQTAMDDIEQYSQRNCLTFNGIQEQEESHENTDLIVVDIRCKNLGVNLSRGGFGQDAQTGKEKVLNRQAKTNYHEIRELS